ncbi:hypothetical protein [Streptomyces cyaneofuscatus]|uniref:hypothetical protein n=1 Tax=Streptomyces cyaneofuscatus TaxID=66883 RepID=UPI003652FC89
MSTLPLYHLALTAFQDAQARLQENLASVRDPGMAMVSAMEAAYWANALDLRLRADDQSYRQLTGDGPELMRALRFVRNRAAHQLPLVVQQSGGIQLPFTLPATLLPVVICWVSASALPPADRGHEDRKGEACYAKWIEGQAVWVVVEEVRRWLATEQTRPGSLLA